MHGQSESSEQTSSDDDGPILEEFIPIKRRSSDDDEQHLQKSTISSTNNKEKEKNNSDKRKSDWLRSVQLWYESPDPHPKEVVEKKVTVVEVKRNGGAFRPFRREKNVGKTIEQQTAGKDKANALVPTAAASSTTESVNIGGSGKKEDDDNNNNNKEGKTQKKQRRCWSPELHRRFLHTLQQLGGSQDATPKQIRELMKVDGLTNDEVKSHLQKYRLHTRRPSPTMHNNLNTQAPQFVVVGGIWLPPPEYANSAGEAAAATVAASNGIYAPVAIPPPAFPHSPTSVVQRSQQTKSEHLQSEEGGSHSDNGHRSNASPTTSSSTHTTTASTML